MKRQKYPILEFDPSREAIIEPDRRDKPIDGLCHAVICFFPEVIASIRDAEGTEVIFERHWESGARYMYRIERQGQPVVVFHPGVGAPHAAGMLEYAIALGCRKFIACGGAGVLEQDLAVGHLLVPTSAVRDEGTSYHYLPPSREVAASPEAVAAIEATLRVNEIEYALCKTWTTDAFFRETVDKVRLRTEEGCQTVEMEAAAFFAVAHFRGVKFGQILYAGDTVSGRGWDGREWTNRKEIRQRLFDLSVEACLKTQ